MKWFKHETNASADAKLRRVRMKYGMEGYGLYWYCLEQIGATVEPHNLTFELEHDAEIIADDTNIHYERVQEMMAYMIDLGLFESETVDEKILITCMKMRIRTDEYTQKALRNSTVLPIVRTTSGEGREKVPSNRKKERKKDISGRFTPPTPEEVRKYAEEKGYQVDAERFCNFYGSKGWMVGRNKMKSWKLALANWSGGSTNNEDQLKGAI